MNTLKTSFPLMCAVFSAIIVFALLAAAPSQATPTAVVNLTHIFEGCKEKGQLESQLRIQKEKLEVKLKTATDRLKQIKSEIELLQVGTSKHTTLLRESSGIVNDMKFEREQAARQFESDKRIFHDQLIDKIRLCIAKVAKEQGYKLVVPTQLPIPESNFQLQSVAYFDSTIDISERVLTELNK